MDYKTGKLDELNTIYTYKLLKKRKMYNCDAIPASYIFILNYLL